MPVALKKAFSLSENSIELITYKKYNKLYFFILKYKMLYYTQQEVNY